MSHWTATGTLVIGCILALYIRRRALTRRNVHPLPPGPLGLPWIGNVIGLDTNAPWQTYTQWAKTYGDIVYSRFLGKDVIILSSEEAAHDLLEKRSTNYSDRPRFTVVEDMYGLEYASGLLPYGDRWRLHRRFFHQTFRLDAALRFLPLQHRKACQLLRQLLATPEQFDDHLFEYTVSITLNCTYDYDPASRNDEIFDLVANYLPALFSTLRPDIMVILCTFPFLSRLPSWFPGVSFKRNMEVARAYTKNYLEHPFEYSLRKASRNSHVVPAMVYDGLQFMEEKGLLSEESSMKALMHAAGTAFLAGSESTTATLAKFFLMMMLNPGAQEKAQVQIDAVVGKCRLPSTDDRLSLPFVDAILRETLRYIPVSPLAFPHVTVDEDVYKGFYIPKGAYIIANVWSMVHDEARYPNPHAFIPERFLDDDGSLKPNDMEHLAFGFGRRICPARHFADTSLWSIVAKVLAVFKILKPMDEHGEEISTEPKFSGGVAIHPLPFKCRIVPRFPGMNIGKLEELIGASTA